MKISVNSSVRQPAVAGSFYPDTPEILNSNIDALLNSREEKSEQENLQPKALIVPHAGYIYSGSIAASAYNTLRNSANNIKRVVLLGPSHKYPLRGIATPNCEYFMTPLGKIPLDTKALRSIEKMDCVTEKNEAHIWEHSLEVQLPFLQKILGDFQLIPLVVGSTKPEKLALVLEYLWGGDETLIVVSSDLSHYHSYEEAQQLDDTTTHTIENLSSTLEGVQACGCHPINGLLLAAKRHELQLSTLDVRNSGDTAGSKEHVVGYGAYALH